MALCGQEQGREQMADEFFKSAGGFSLSVGFASASGMGILRFRRKFIGETEKI